MVDNKNIKKQYILIFIMILLLSIPNNVEASLIDLANTMHIGQTNAINSSREMTESILGTFQVLGSVVSVIALIIIGMRYVFSSLEEKAQMKGVIGYYITGCVLVFATSNVVGGAWNVLDGIEHNWKSVETAGTCTTAGKITYTCQDPGCGKVKEEKTSKDPNNHVGGWTNGAITRAATCIAKGKRNQKCNGCSATKSVDIPINADNHTHWSAWSTTLAAKCTAKGKKERTCTDCNAGKEEEYIAKLGHDYPNNWVNDPDNRGTCTSKPKEMRVCKRNGCNETERREYGVVLGHLYVDEITRYPTCEAGGTKRQVCQREGCNSVTGNSAIAALGHDLKDEITRYPTCTAGGTKRQVCQRETCNYATGNSPIAALGHTYYTEITPATCTEAKKYKLTCTTCGNTENYTEGSKKGHDYVEKHYTAPTCTSRGSRTSKCTRCGETDTTTIAATGHNYVHKNYPKTVAGVTWHYERSVCSNCNDERLTKENCDYGPIHLAWDKCSKCCQKESDKD